MKTISLFLLGCAMAIAAAGQTTSTVTINVRGAKTTAVLIDGVEYAVTNENNINTSTPIVVSNLQSGQHKLELKRYDQSEVSSTVFTIRSGYDLNITIAANGSVQLRETKWQGNVTPYTSAMNDADFLALYDNVRSQWRSAIRTKLVSDAFANASYYFTTAQARQLIQQVNNQSDRFALAKASYARIIDPTNFTLMYDLFNSQSYRSQLADYVSNYNAASSSTAMNGARFNTIYRTAQRQTTTNSRVSYIYNAFTNTNNHFTVAQARRLVQLVPDEANRLYLAKISYRSIIDKNNFSQMHTLLNTQASRNELNIFIGSYDNSNPVYTKVAMKDTDYNVMYSDVQNRFGLGAKMAALQKIFADDSYYFTVAQAENLIRLVSAESNRLELAKASYDNIVDQGNFSQLYDVLSGASSRNELDDYVRNYQIQGGTGPSPVLSKNPMSTSNFNSIYTDVRNTWGFGAKMSELTKIFDTETNYFSTAQARQLIQLVSSETNRLQLAKASYDNITDPENFNLMYDLFSSQSRKNELSAFVNTYSYNQ